MNYLPDVNVWVALSVNSHIHCAAAWSWLDALPGDATVMFSRYTQVGLLRLLTLERMMASETMTLGQAWTVYDRWLEDPRIEFYPEPRTVDEALRRTTKPFFDKPASKWVGDCYLLALAHETGAMLATFDRALFTFAKKTGYAAIIPG